MDFTTKLASLENWAQYILPVFAYQHFDIVMLSELVTTSGMLEQNVVI